MCSPTNGRGYYLAERIDFTGCQDLLVGAEKEVGPVFWLFFDLVISSNSQRFPQERYVPLQKALATEKRGGDHH